jgi:hypothetical protein
MADFNTDYNTIELLDQELTIEQLEAVAGGERPDVGVDVIGLNGDLALRAAENMRAGIYGFIAAAILR